MSKTLQTVYVPTEQGKRFAEMLYRDGGLIKYTNTYIYTAQEHQSAQGYREALEEIARYCNDKETTLKAQQALSAAPTTQEETYGEFMRSNPPIPPTTQEECCGRCVGHCYVDNEGEHIELTSLVTRDTNVLEELDKWVANEIMINSTTELDGFKVLAKIKSLKPQP